MEDVNHPEQILAKVKEWIDARNPIMQNPKCVSLTRFNGACDGSARVSQNSD